MRVASQQRHGDTATIGVWIDTGSRFETAKNNGVAHYLEHLLFKGTARRTREALEQEIENMGGHLNAYTSREMTVFYARVFSQDAPKAIDIIGDILQNSTYSKEAVEAERSVILREAQEIDNDLQESVFDHLHAVAFQDHALGRTILGSKKNISSITREDIVDYVKHFYTAPRMVLSAAGAVDHKQIVDLAGKTFGSLPNTLNDATIIPARFVGADVRVRNDDLPEAHVVFAVEGSSWTNSDSIPLMICQALLGSWDRTAGSGSNITSPMCQTLAEQNLVSSVTAFNTCYKDTGLFGVYAVANPSNLDDMAFHVFDEMMRLCFRTTEEEVARARNQLKAALLMHLDDTSAVCEDIGRQMLTYGRRMSPAELFARIDAVSAKDVREVAMKYFYDQEVACSAIGPVLTLPDLNKLRRSTYLLRY